MYPCHNDDLEHGDPYCAEPSDQNHSIKGCHFHKSISLHNAIAHSGINFAEKTKASQSQLMVWIISGLSITSLIFFSPLFKDWIDLSIDFRSA